MDVPQLLQESQALAEWLWNASDGIKIKSEERSVLAAGCFHVGLEHFTSITLLTANGMHGSSVALVRLIFESLIRGIWLHHCASEAQVILYRQDELDLKLFKLLNAVEQVDGWKHGKLSQLKGKYWKAMNSFTHSGVLQSSRRFDGVDIQSAYDSEDISNTLKFSGSLAILTTIAFADLANNVELASTILEKAKEYAASTAV